MSLSGIMAPRCLLLPLTIILVAASNQDLAASTIERLSFVDLSRDAQLIVQGTVSERRLENRDGLPWTCVNIEVEKLIVGSAGTSVDLCFLGGRTGTTMTAVTGSLIPASGKRGIFFTYDLSANFVNPIVGWSQGLYYLESQSGREFVTTASGAIIKEVSFNEELPPINSLDAASGILTAKAGETDGLSSADFIRAIHLALVQP